MNILERTDMGEYIVQKEEHQFGIDPEELVVYEVAYTPDGKYIGDPDMAAFLTSEGIKPEFRTPTSTVCSIGFCELTQKWYGWSHRAIKGFAIGDRFRGQTIKTIDQAKEVAKIFAESVS